ncbi:adenylate cyclase [Aquipluma nitroreducens]|uniref:histidine kinase n=1 Tax=Aquipluma nitroreducens TaxID=2010828 RepID=A0A5K7SGX6_9BACT|nr:two-component regulator propeller domain-containing protein [Aquipluma nitroreducens]BBE20851.1 adenylate cyclase [Aquipluma nitroreducens]
MNKILLTILIILLTLACTKQQSQDTLLVHSPLIVEAKGFIIPEDSVARPKIVLAGQPTRITVGKPNAIYTNTNEFLAGQPTIILAGNPRINTPGQNSFLIPKTVTAIDKPFIGGMPIVETAKDAYIKDQNPQNFSTFGKHQGLNYNSIHCQLQDISGNIWFCTYGGGVSRYDGKSFTHFTTKEGLGNDRIWSVLQDKSGNLWFGTDGGGASRYDGKFFTHFTTKEGLSGNSVLSMLQDRNGDIWFATTEGLSKYDGKSFTHYSPKEGLCDNTILSILQDKSGNLWFGSGEHGVSKYDGKSFSNFSESEGLVNNTVFYILQDRDENIWFGTNGGVSCYNGKSFSNYTNHEGLSDNKIYSIFQDSLGAYWFGTGRGITKLTFNVSEPDEKLNSPKRGVFTHITENDGLCNNLVYSILNDKSGNIWFGTNEGVSKYGGSLFTHYTRNEGLSNNKVFSILKDKSGNLWFGTFGGGIIRYDGKSFLNYTEKEGLANDKVFSMFQDKSGNMWFGTDGGGVSKYDGKSFTNFTQKEGLSNNKVFCIAQDKPGNLWFGTYGGGVSKYDGQSFTNYTVKEGLCNNFVLSILNDRNGNLWFGTDGGGVSNLILEKSDKLHGNTTIKSQSFVPQFINYTTKDGLPNNYVFSIFQDNDENIWFGTGGGGLAKFDGKYFTTYTENEGLSNNNVLSITQDKNDNLWFGTRFGLSKLKSGALNANANNAGLPLFNNFAYEDGFLGIGCNRGAICQDKAGTIWIGTNDRLIAYHGDGDIADTISPEIQLTGISLFNEKIKWSNLLSDITDSEGHFQAKDTSIILENGVTVTDFNFDTTSKWYYIPQNLSLKYNNNFLTFSFIGISQRHNKKMRYQYKLEGLDKTWIALTLSTDASYGNLSPGTYIFKIKARNGEGYWSKEFAYQFTIRPPWWKTGWFRLIMVVFILTSLFVLYRWRITSLKTQQRYLERIVKEKTAEVVNQSIELQGINDELRRQKEALEVANATKDRFFSIIAHDLRNPFSGFLGLTEIMAEDLASLTLTEIQDLAQGMNKSATNLYHLLENLLQWSLMQREAIPFNPEIIPLLATLDDSITMLLESAKRKNIVLTYDIPDQIKVYADANSLQTIFRNLVSNAVKFTRNGGHVNVSAWIEAGQKVVVAIKDSGIGISSKMLNDLFRIDVKTNRVGTAGELSSGLGLFLCKDFVEKHGGEIWVESVEGTGSTFYFTLQMHD